MERLLQTLKDPSKLSVLSTALFFVGIATSTFFLYTLPHDLVFKGGMTTSGLATWVFAKTFLVVATTFVFAFLAIHFSLKSKKDVIVFKEKIESANNQTGTAEEKAASIDIQTFTNTIKGAKADKVLQLGLNSICHLLQAGQGAFYVVKIGSGKQVVEMKNSFALTIPEGETVAFDFGEGLVGQAAATGKSMYLDELPEGYSNAIVSGLGTASPKYLFVAPVKKENVVKAVMEIATFSPLSEVSRRQAEEMAALLAERI